MTTALRFLGRAQKDRIARRIAATALVAATAGAGLTACSSDDDSGSATDSISMATQPWLGYGPWYIAQDKGYFADQDLDVNITSFNTTGPAEAFQAINGNVAPAAAISIKAFALSWGEILTPRQPSVMTLTA